MQSSTPRSSYMSRLSVSFFSCALLGSESLLTPLPGNSLIISDDEVVSTGNVGPGVPPIAAVVPPVASRMPPALLLLGVIITLFVFIN